jgi:siroheme synthase-like protein
VGFYPIALELTGRPCLVVGGGSVAERKVTALLQANASVTVVSPRVTPARAARINLVARRYRRCDVAGQGLVFVTTDDRAVNAAVARDARARGIWVNAADDPPHCDFILPSVLRRGALIVAVSTGGASPALARAIREQLEEYFTEEYDVLARVLAAARRELHSSGLRPEPDAWRQALGRDLLQLIAAGDADEAKDQLVRRLREAVCI